jgi:nicotinamide-nucleotide amidase
VTYSLESKVRDLGLDPEVLRRHGAVSRVTALAMAEGARERAGAEIGLSTTGEAGPEPSETDVGRCFVGLAYPGGSLAHELMLPGERERVQTLASQAALDLLRRWLLGGDELARG